MISPLVHIAAADSSSSGIGALGIHLQAFIIQLITFVLAFFVLRRYAFGPIMKVMNERRTTIEQGVKLGEQMQKDKAELETKTAQILRDARQQADTIVADAQAAGRDVVHGAETQASEKAAQIVNEGKARGEQEVNRARKQMESEIAGLVAEATEAIIDVKVDAKKDAQLIDRALKGAKA